VAFAASIGAVRQAPDRAFGVAALVVSALELLGLLVMVSLMIRG